jgi:hypothetical protein
MKPPRSPKNPRAPKPRNVAAKALREGRFQPKVEADPKAYSRRRKHPAPPDIEVGDAKDET